MDDLGSDLVIGARVDDLNEPPIRPPEPLAKTGLKNEKFTTQKRTATKNARLAHRQIRFLNVVLMLHFPSLDGKSAHCLKNGNRKPSGAVPGEIVGPILENLWNSSILVGRTLLAATAVVVWNAFTRPTTSSAINNNFIMICGKR